MKIVLQRVRYAKCTIDGSVFSQIGNGYALLLGVHSDDTFEIALKMIDKITNLRIFEDENGKINKNISAVGGNILLIPQFTLCADCKKGNRPNFLNASAPESADNMFNFMVSNFKKTFPDLKCGKFGANMKIELLNDGPFTLVLDSKELF